MEQPRHLLWVDDCELTEEELDQLQEEVAEEALAIHIALEATGRWRSPQDCWVDARAIVIARRSS